MTAFKTILVILILVHGITTHNSLGKGLSRGLPDTIPNADVSALRQKFWDSLPNPASGTSDFDSLFSDHERVRLDSIIEAFEKEDSIQIWIVTLDTVLVSREKFDEMAYHMGTEWSFAANMDGNAIVICISKGYRRMRIANGSNVAKVLSDGQTKNLIEDKFIPAYRKGEYFNGTWNGLTALIQAIRQNKKR